MLSHLGRARVFAPHTENPIGYNGMLHIYPQMPKCPFPFEDYHLNLIHPSLNRPTQNPERHPDIQSTILPQYAFRTDEQIDRWDNRQLCTKSAYARALRIVNDALISALMHVFSNLALALTLASSTPS